MVRNGIQTSEFYLSVAVLLTAIVLRLLKLIDQETFTYLLLSALLPYTASRTILKAKRFRGEEDGKME